MTRIVNLGLEIETLTDPILKQESISALVNLYENYSINKLKEYFPKTDWEVATRYYEIYKRLMPVRPEPSYKPKTRDFKDLFRTLFTGPLLKPAPDALREQVLVRIHGAGRVMMADLRGFLEKTLFAFQWRKQAAVKCKEKANVADISSKDLSYSTVLRKVAAERKRFQRQV